MIFPNSANKALTQAYIFSFRGEKLIFKRIHQNEISLKILFSAKKWHQNFKCTQKCQQNLKDQLEFFWRVLFWIWPDLDCSFDFLK